MHLSQRVYVLCAMLCTLATASFAADRPNILVIWGDDIGWETLVHTCHIESLVFTLPMLDHNPVASISTSEYYE